MSHLSGIHNYLANIDLSGIGDSAQTVIRPGLNMRESAVMDAIESYGMSPTTEEIAMVTGMSSETVRGQLLKLERKGFITREFGVRRSIRVVDGKQGGN